MQARFELWTDGIVWHQAGDHPLAGDTGKEQVVGFFAGLVQQTDGAFAVELQHAIADNDHAYNLHKATATKDGENLESWAILRYRFDAERSRRSEPTNTTSGSRIGSSASPIM